VTVSLRGGGDAGQLREALREHELEGEAVDRLGARVAVGEGEGAVFLYTGTREAAREAEHVIRGILREHELEADLEIHRWHPLEERWEDERVPLPTTDAERRAEHRRLEEDEIAASEELGAALWEVRIELDSHRDAVALAERIETERESLVPGWTVSVVRRWKYLLIGASNEAQAREIAAALERELPAGATLQVEPSGALARRPNPFAVFRRLRPM
jgi:hypothetical protein